jgi:hypothetical protein
MDPLKEFMESIDTMNTAKDFDFDTEKPFLDENNIPSDRLRSCSHGYSSDGPYQLLPVSAGILSPSNPEISFEGKCYM